MTPTAAQGAGKEGTPPFPANNYAIYVVSVLMLVTLSSLLDRQLPTLLVEPLKRSFALSDTQFSLLQGSAFAIFYTVMGIPFGRMVDHANRRNLILFGLVLWSIMTVLAGLVDSYWQLLVTRIGIGIGEACLAPAAYSIIADYFPAHRRARAITTYYLSLTLGAGASMIVGGLILPLLPPDGLSIAFIGTLLPWKLMFIIVGLPGLLLTPLILTIREPVRREVGSATTVVEKSSVGDFLRHVWQHRMTFLCVISSASAIGIVGWANMSWAPTFFERRFGISVASSGPLLGMILMLAGLGGSILSGFLSDRWIKRGVTAARFRVTTLAWIITLPASIAWPLVPSATLSYILLLVTFLGVILSQAANPVVIQEIVPNRMRGQAIAGYLLVAGLVVMGFGPTAPALLTDHLFHDEHALGPALALVAILSGLIGPLASWYGLRPYERSWMSIVGATSPDRVEIPPGEDARSQSHPL